MKDAKSLEAQLGNLPFLITNDMVDKVKVGDKVKVVKEGTYDWVDDMNRYIGKTLTVEKIELGIDDHYVTMHFIDVEWNFYSDGSLEKV